MDNTVTHIAGNRIQVGQRVIQRCSLCGEKLCDNARAAMVMHEEISGEEMEFPTWEVGRLVRISGENPTQYELLADSERLPDDSCIELIED